MGIPKPPDTPRETPNARGRYSQLDDRMLLERTADNALQAKQEARALREEWKELRRPYARPWYERGAPAAIAVVLLAMLVAYTTRCSTAPREPRPAVEASR